MAQTTSKIPGKVRADNVDVAVTQSGNTELLDLIVDDVTYLGVELAVTGQALDAFLVQGRMSPDGAYQTLYSVAGDFTSPAGLVVDASGDLTVLGAGASGWLLLNVLPLYSVKILASSGNLAGSTVTARAIGRA